MIIEDRVEMVGYRVSVFEKEIFRVTGFTLIVPPGKRGSGLIGKFWDQVAADGRLARLKAASAVPPTILGLGSWDEECEEKGQRYTICIEETSQTEFSILKEDTDLFTKELGATAWMCFEMSEKEFFARFWKDNPYKMMKKLGYEFNMAGYETGVHFDVYPPEYDTVENPQIKFWITVVKANPA